MNIDEIKKLPPDAKRQFVKYAQKFVGGYVEIVRLNDGILIVNEEGKIKQLEYNEPASKLYAESYGDLDIIFGPAIYIPNNVPSQWHG